MTTRREKPDVIGTSSLSERGHHDGWLAHRHRPLAARACAYLAPVAVSGAAVRGSVRSSSCSGRCRQAGAVLVPLARALGAALGAEGISVPESMRNYRNCGDPPSAGSRAQWRTLRTVTIPPRDAGPRLKIVVSRVGIRISPGLVTAASACRRSSAPPPARRLQGTSLGRVRAPAFLGQTLALPRRALAAVSSSCRAAPASAVRSEESHDRFAEARCGGAASLAGDYARLSRRAPAV